MGEDIINAKYRFFVALLERCLTVAEKDPEGLKIVRKYLYVSVALMCVLLIKNVIVLAFFQIYYHFFSLFNVNI